MLVHITNNDEIASIRRSGIRIGKFRDGVYAMPVLENFVVSAGRRLAVSLPAGTYKSRIFRQRFYDRD